MRFLCLGAGIIAIALASGPLQASTVFVNGTPSDEDRRQFSGVTVYEDFQFSADTPVTGATIEFIGMDGGDWSFLGWDGVVTYSVLSDDPLTKPGTVLASGSATATLSSSGALTGFGNARVSFQAPFLASAGVRYWLGIEAPTAPQMLFMANATGQVFGSMRWRTTFDGQLANIAPTHLYFSLQGPDTGVIPEPSTWTLMIFGFGLLAQRLRRRHLEVRYS
jgi:hypothetical protein